MMSFNASVAWKGFFFFYCQMQFLASVVSSFDHCINEELSKSSYELKIYIFLQKLEEISGFDNTPFNVVLEKT